MWYLMLWCCCRNQKFELERRQSSGYYRAKAYDKMKYRTRDGPWVKWSNVVLSTVKFGIIIKPPLQKRGITQKQRPSVCLFVCLSVNCCWCVWCCWRCVPASTSCVSQMFLVPWKTSPCEIYASGGGLFVAPINASLLLDSCLCYYV